MGFAGQKWALTVSPKPIGVNKVFLIPSEWVQLEWSMQVWGFLCLFELLTDVLQQTHAPCLLSPVPHEV